MGIKKYIILISAVIVISSCGGFLELFDDELSLKKESFNGNQLRLDGFYYREKLDQKYNSTSYDFYYLYKDGTLFYVSSKDFNYYKREDFNLNGFQKENYNWGVFQVKEDSIVFEKWTAGEVSKVLLYSGRVLNDTTFMINEGYGSNERKKIKEIRAKNIEKKHETYYHFKQYSPKPDSTNRFVK